MPITATPTPGAKLLSPQRPHPDPDRPPVADGVRHPLDRRRHAAQQRRLVAQRGRRLQRRHHPRPPSPRRPSPARCSTRSPRLPRPDAARPHLHEHLGRRRRDRAGQPDRQDAHRAWPACGPPSASSARPCRRIDQGFEVYVITDACGDVSDEAHERAIDRMVQAGAQPMTVAAVPAGAAARLGPRRDLRHDHRHRRRSSAAPMASASSTPRSMFNASEGGHWSAR